VIQLLSPFILLLPPPLPSSSSSRMRNLDGWMTGQMTNFLILKKILENFDIKKMKKKQHWNWTRKMELFGPY
jgi:hypothetical protein